MEKWQLEFEWGRVRRLVKEAFRKDQEPGLDVILYLIGIQELGLIKRSFTKEEKQDLMHIAVCKLLSFDGYYEFIGKDQDGWPHWELIAKLPFDNLEEQECYLKQKIVQYFQNLESQNGGFNEPN
jgi:hypothetical protein